MQRQLLTLVTEPHPESYGPSLTAAEHRLLTLLLYLDGKALCEAKHDVPISGSVLRKLIARKYVQVLALSPARYRVTGLGQVVRANGVL